MAPKSPQPTAIISAMLYSLNDDFLRTKSVPSSREAFILWQPPCVRDWSGILLELFLGNGDVNGNGNWIWERGCEQRYSGKPDGAAGTPQDNVQLTINNVQLTTDGLISAPILAIREASKIISRKFRAHSRTK